MTAKKDDSGVFDSVHVHYGSDRACFNSNRLKANRFIITMPSAWPFKPLTEVGLTFQLPLKKTEKERSIQCRGIVVECRPEKQKGHYQVDLVLTEIPQRDADTFEKLMPNYSHPWNFKANMVEA